MLYIAVYFYESLRFDRSVLSIVTNRRVWYQYEPFRVLNNSKKGA